MDRYAQISKSSDATPATGWKLPDPSTKWRQVPLSEEAFKLGLDRLRGDGATRDRNGGGDDPTEQTETGKQEGGTQEGGTQGGGEQGGTAGQTITAPAPGPSRKPIAPVHESAGAGASSSSATGSPQSSSADQQSATSAGKKSAGKKSSARGGAGNNSRNSAPARPEPVTYVAADIDLSLAEDRVTPNELLLMSLEQYFGLARDEAERMKKVEKVWWTRSEGRTPTDAEFQEGFVRNVSTTKDFYDRMNEQRPYLGKAIDIERLVEQGAHAWVFELVRRRDISDFLPSLPEGLTERFNNLLRRASRTLLPTQLDTFNQKQGEAEGLIDDITGLWNEARKALTDSDKPGAVEQALTPWTGKMQGREVVRRFHELSDAGELIKVLRWADMPALLWHLAAYDPQSAVEIGLFVPLTPEARQEWLDIIADYAIASWRDHGPSKADILIAPIFDRLQRLEYMDQVLVRIARRSKVKEMFKSEAPSEAGPGYTSMPLTMAIIQGRGLSIDSYRNMDATEGWKEVGIGTLRGVRDTFVPIMPIISQADYATEIEGLPEEYRAMARQAQSQELKELLMPRPQDFLLGPMAPGMRMAEGLVHQGIEGTKNLLEGNYETGMQQTTPVVATVIDFATAIKGGAVAKGTAAREEATMPGAVIGTAERGETALMRIGQTARAAESSEGFLQAILRNRADGDALWSRLMKRPASEIAEVSAYARADRKVAMFLYREGEEGFAAIRAAKGDAEIASELITGNKAIDKGAKNIPRVSGRFTSTDKYVGELANALDREFPGEVLDVNVKVMDGSLEREFDVEMKSMVIEVKSGNAGGVSTDMGRKADITDKFVVGYTPEAKHSVIKGGIEQGKIIVRDYNSLVAIIRKHLGK